MRTRDRNTTRMAVAGLFAAAGLALAGCGADEPEAGTDVEDVVEGEVAETSPAAEGTVTVPPAAGAPYAGPYNRGFYDQTTAYDGQEVTLTGEVEEVFATDSPTALTISDPNDAELGDLLVIAKDATMSDLAADQVVEVVGTVRTDFQLTRVETDLALDLEDELFQDFEGDPYIEATEINMDATS